MFKDGLTGTMTAFELCLLGSICQVGLLVEVVEFIGDEAGCPADLDGDGVVDVHDLLAVIAAWGGPGGDADSDGVTDVGDLLLLVGSWGPCEA